MGLDPAPYWNTEFKNRVGAWQELLDIGGEKVGGRTGKWDCRKKAYQKRRDEILAPGARLQVILKERGGEREMEIHSNRKGLRSLAAICSGLAELTQEQLLTPANHYHLDEYFWGTEKGSIPLIALCREDGWPEPSPGPNIQVAMTP